MEGLKMKYCVYTNASARTLTAKFDNFEDAKKFVDRKKQNMVIQLWKSVMMVFQLETTTGQKEISDKTTDLKLTISAIRWRK